MSQLGANVIIADSILGQKPTPATTNDVVNQLFARDSGFIIDNKFITPSATALERHFLAPYANASSHLESMLAAALASEFILKKQLHAATIVQAFRQAKIALDTVQIDAAFDGGDVIVDPHKGIIFIGHDPTLVTHETLYNDEQLRSCLAAATGADIIPIDRAQATYAANGKALSSNTYHLDTFMASLPHGELLFDQRSVLPTATETLRKIYGPNLICVGHEPSRLVTSPMGNKPVPCYPTNLTSIGQTLLMPACGKELKGDLQKRSYKIVAAEDLGVSPGHLYMLGGSIHCITQSIPSNG